MRILSLALGLMLASGAASAQSIYPPQPYGAGIDQHRYRMEMQRMQSAEQAAFARQSRLEARVAELELRDRRQAEPYIPLVDTLPTPLSPAAQAQRQARDRARGEAVAQGVGQIDDWLDRGPR